MTPAERRSRWARRNVVVGLLAFVCWQALVLLTRPSTAALLLAVCGFVCHVLFGKAYALVPSYFDRTLTPAWAPAAQLPLTTLGVTLMAVGYLARLDTVVATLGATLWSAGVVVFTLALAWSLRGNLAGTETGTGDHNAHRQRLDRYANPFILVAVAYLLVGSIELLAALARTADPLLANSIAGAIHLLAAGGAVLALVAVGFRLLPRFLVASPPFSVPAVALPAAAVGPVLLASSLGHGPLFVAGALAEAVGVGSFAAAYLLLFVRSERDRVGLRGVALGVLAGVAAVAVGVSFTRWGVDPTLVVVHRRLNLVGLLGLSILGVAFQFYPPAVGGYRLSTDRTAGVALAAVASGLVLEVAGLVGWPASALVDTGRLLSFGGVVLAVALLGATLRET